MYWINDSRFTSFRQKLLDCIIVFLPKRWRNAVTATGVRSHLSPSGRDIYRAPRATGNGSVLDQLELVGRTCDPQVLSFKYASIGPESKVC
jgi:hypothetical protein